MPAPSPGSVRAYVSRLARRALLLHGTRALVAGLGVGAAALVLQSTLLGPVVTPVWALAGMLLPMLLGVAVAARVLVASKHELGERSASLLAARDPALASRTRTALENSQEPPRGASRDLVDAHRRAVEVRLLDLPPARVLPMSRLRDRAVGAGLMALVISLLLVAGHPRVRANVLALLHPVAPDAEGRRVADVVEELRAELTYPGYLGRASEELVDPSHIVAPRGTSVELRVRFRLPVERAVLRLGERELRMAQDPQGGFVSRLVVRGSHELAIQGRREGHWYRDRKPREVEALSDEAPTVELQAPTGTPLVRVGDALPLRLRASDDVGVRQVDLVAQRSDGSELRRRLWSAPDSKEPQRDLEHHGRIVPAELGGKEGDVIIVWLEARDGDVVSGPNVGRSQSVQIEVASDSQELLVHIPKLQALLDGVIQLLADRLEQPVPNSNPEAVARFGRMSPAQERWLMQLRQLLAGLKRSAGPPPLDLELLQGIHDRNRRLLGRERTQYGPGAHSHSTRLRADGRSVEEQENNTIALADMVAEALVNEARGLAADLQELKDQMRSLLERLKEADDPAAKEQLLAEIARARQRLEELARSLAQVAAHVPGEFINREALPEGSAAESMEDLRGAVEEDDMAAAARHLEELAEQVERMAEKIERSGLRFQNARFGPRDAALNEAQRKLGMISQEQGRLASESSDVVRRAMERADRATSGPGIERLQQMAGELQEKLDGMKPAGMAGHERTQLERSRSRLQDTNDALRTGDLAEAARMAEAAKRAMDQAAGELDRNARMFPGHQGQTMDNAKTAGAAARDMGELQRGIEQATPRLGKHTSSEDRRELQGNAEPQRRTRDAAAELAQELGQGPDGTPLSPEGSGQLEQAQRAMKEAEQALRKGDARAANRAQEDAAERLRQVSEKLNQKRKGGGKGQQQSASQQQGSGGGEGRQMDRSPVDIPGAEDFKGPQQMRRRLLDAMREPAPAEYGAAVERYYRELLR